MADDDEAQAAMEAAIRRNERFRLSALLTQHGDAIAQFTGDGQQAIRLVAYLLRLDANVDQPSC